MNAKREFDWFDRPENRKLLWRVLYLLCGLSLLFELTVDSHGHFGTENLFALLRLDFSWREGHFGWDGYFGAYALLGFLACTAAILLAKLLGRVLKVKEDHYDDAS